MKTNNQGRALVKTTIFTLIVTVLVIILSILIPKLPRETYVSKAAVNCSNIEEEDLCNYTSGCVWRNETCITSSNPPSSGANSTPKCPSGVGTYMGSSLCNQQCSKACLKCLLNTTEKYYCPAVAEGKLPKCTTPNAFNKGTCEGSCGGASSCEPCDAGGVQKYHCKLNVNSPSLRACTGGTYFDKPSCNPHCVTQCRECKLNNTIKFECPSEFNDLPKCTQSRTYDNPGTCRAECDNCTLCEITKGTNRYECNGKGPTIPPSQAPVGLGDCNSSEGIIKNGQSKCKGSYQLSCFNSQITQEFCDYGCSNNRCNPPPTQPPEPEVTEPETAEIDEKKPEIETGIGQCYFGLSTCTSLNRYTLNQDKCTNCPVGSAVCCGNIITASGKVCTPYERLCENGIIKTCRADGTDWLNPINCASGQCLDSQNCLEPNKYNTQCTSLNIGKDCSYAINGQTYLGKCQCTNNSCSCLGNAQAPPAPTVILTAPSPTKSPMELHCQRSCDGTCITRPDGTVDCIPYTTQESETDALTTCGGLYQPCCLSVYSLLTSSQCNLHLTCTSRFDGICVADQAYEKAAAAAEVLDDYLTKNDSASQNPQCKYLSCASYSYVDSVCTPTCQYPTPYCCAPKTANLNETINDFIEKNVGTDPLAQEQFKEKLGSSCTERDGQTPCSGSCVFSNTQKKFVCITLETLNSHYEKVKEEGAKNIGDNCVPVVNPCRSELLECVGFKCQIKDEAKQFLAYGAAENPGGGGKDASLAPVINTAEDTLDLLDQFATDETQSLTENKELAYGACNSVGQAGTYSLRNGQCWVCLDPLHNSMTNVPLEYCSNEQLQQQGANFGIACRAVNNYCAKTSSSCISTGQSDCPNNWLCCDSNQPAPISNPKKTGQINQSCSEYNVAGDDDFGHTDDTCLPGLKCVNKVCRDEISLAYDDDYNSGTSGTNDWGGLFNLVINPMIRSISPAYYETGETRAEVTQSSMDSCYETAQANGTDPTTCDALYTTTDQLAQANMTQNKLEEINPEGLNTTEKIYNAVMDLGKFASAYSGVEKTVSTLTYAEKSAQANADPNANALDYLGAAVQPGLEIGMTVADVATLGLGDSIFSAAGKALKTAAVEISQGAIKTGIKEVVQETTEQVIKEAGQQIAEEVAERTAREAVQKITEEITQEAAQQILKETTQQAAEEVAEKVTQKVTQALVAQSTEQAALEAAEIIARELAQQAGKELSPEIIEKTVREVTEKVIKQMGPKINTQITGETAQRMAREIIEEATEKAAKEAAERASTEIGQKTVQEIAQETAQKITQETAQQINTMITRDTVREAAQEIAQQISEEFSQKITKEMSPEAIKQTIIEASQTVTREVAEKLVETTSRQTISTGRQIVARGLQIVGTALDTGKMSQQLLKVPVIGPILNVTEKVAATVIAGPLLAGAGGLGLVNRAIKASPLPNLFRTLFPNFGKSPIERAVSELISKYVSQDLSLETLQKIEAELIAKHGAEATQEIQQALQKQAVNLFNPKPITSLTNPGDLWKKLQQELASGINLEEAIVKLAKEEAQTTGQNIYDIIPQMQALAQAQQLAHRWGINLSQNSQVENYLTAYSHLLERQAQGQVTTPRSFVTELVNGGLDFASANKLAGGMLYDESSLLLTAKKAQQVAEREFDESLTKYEQAQADYQKAVKALEEAKAGNNKISIDNAQRQLAEAEQQLNKARELVVAKAEGIKNNTPLKQAELSRAQRNLEIANAAKKQSDLNLQQAKDSLAKAQQELADLQALLKQAQQPKSITATIMNKVKRILGKDRMPTVAELTTLITQAQAKLDLAQQAFDQASRLAKQTDLNLAIAQKKFDRLLDHVDRQNPILEAINKLFNNSQGPKSSTITKTNPPPVVVQQKILLEKTNLTTKIDDQGQLIIDSPSQPIYLRRGGKVSKVNPGTEVKLNPGDEIYLTNNPHLSANNPKMEWLRVNKKGQLDHYQLEYKPNANSQTIVRKVQSLLDDPRQVGQIDTYKLKINNQPDVNFHVARNHDYPGTSDQLVRELASTVEETRAFLGPNVKNANDSIDILLVSGRTNNRPFATGKGTIVMDYSQNLLNTRDILAHELTHQLTGISPLLSLTEGIAVYTGAMVTGGKLDASHLTPDHRHYQDLVDLVNSRKDSGGSISETQLFTDLNARGKVHIEPQNEYSYIVGVHYAQAIDQLHGIEDMVDLMKISSDYFDRSWATIRVRTDLPSPITINGKIYPPGSSISNRDALDFLLETKFGKTGKAQILHQVEENILNASQNLKIKPKIDSTQEIIKVGRNSNNHWQINNSHVSREQFTIAHNQSGEIILYDHSTNGTFIKRGNTLLPYQDTAVIRNNDRLVLGGTNPPIEFVVKVNNGQVELKPAFPTGTDFQFHPLTGNPSKGGNVVQDLLPNKLNTPAKLQTEAADFEIVTTSHGNPALAISATNSNLIITRGGNKYQYGTNSRATVQPGDKITMNLTDGRQVTFEVNQELITQIKNGNWQETIKRMFNDGHRSPIDDLVNPRPLGNRQTQLRAPTLPEIIDDLVP